MKNLDLSRSFVVAANGWHAAFILGLFLTLSFVPLSTRAQTTPPEQTTTTTRVVANAAQEVVPSKSVVRGRVVYDDTNRPVRRTRVMLLELNSTGRERSGMTNGSGEFQIKDVPAGTYVVMVDASGVITPLSFVDIDDKAEKFNLDEVKKHFDEVVVDGNRDVTVKVRAKRGGAISGKVTFSDGDPAVNVRVTVMRRKDGRLTRFITNLNPTAMFGIQTDDRGMYRFPGLAPGEYIISASETVAHDGEKGSQPGGGYMDMFGGNSMVVTYYKDATKSSDASVVKIDLGQDQNEINITLVDRVLHTISGAVVARNGSAPLGGAPVSITSKDNAGAGSTLMMPTSVLTDAQGLFTFNEMPDGAYTLAVEPPYRSENVEDTEVEDPPTSSPSSAPSQKQKFARKEHDVTVNGSDVTDLTIKLSEGVSVSGIVTVDGANALPQDTFVQLETASREPVADGKRVEMDGRFSIDGVPSGAFYANVLLSLGSHYYVKTMTVNGIDLMSDPLIVGENADVNDVRVVVSGDGATLSGRILSGNNTPVNGVQLALIPSDQRKWRARASYLLGVSNNDGRYGVNGAPGDYLIIFLRDVDQPQAINEAWIRDRSTTAEHLTLLPSERKNLDLTMPRQ